ncbi:hypothetical protein BDW02DRAFT_360994 [Decorospora gaudefroyi]|uniref:Uncharacterized protein n=1 Tax=Decorospora gaudefroyi TaxID=184978 RepID=A0A6A5KEE8_9PLEO|nr:hypothetical protein BDW02DRAFT_360994 [Decorospora gaudefroyi]
MPIFNASSGPARSDWPWTGHFSSHINVIPTVPDTVDADNWSTAFQGLLVEAKRRSTNGASAAEFPLVPRSSPFLHLTTHRASCPTIRSTSALWLLYDVISRDSNISTYATSGADIEISLCACDEPGCWLQKLHERPNEACPLPTRPILDTGSQYKKTSEAGIK